MRFCQRGHELKPENTYVRPNGQRTCKTCKQAYEREYRQRNLEKLKAYKREYRQRNSEKLKAYERAYYEQHRDELLAYSKRHQRGLKERHGTPRGGIKRED